MTVWCDHALIINPYRMTVCRSEKAYKRALKDAGVKKSDRRDWVNEGAHATVHIIPKTKRHDHLAIVCIDCSCGPTATQVIALLAHEAAHIWQRIRDHINEKSPSAEFEAYAIQNILGQLIEAYDQC